MTDLPKTFDPADIEARWAARWEAEGLFRPDRPDAQPFTIVNPPPNVTGALHIGHALDNTLQDVIVRYERMRGKDVRWVVGTDHAGIATQMVVERNIASQGLNRRDMGREAFLEHVWEWKAQSGDTMGRQLRRLGCSMDWANERFTMDEDMSTAVVEAFVRLHEAGLVYRDKRLVNWDPALGTAISDLEVETREVAGNFWHLRYPLADGAVTGTGSKWIVVATTRPETLLADMAVAVHPDDDRYRELVARGAEVILPITGRRVPIIADDHADPALGSGAVKITPGHDFNDFEVGVRAGIEPRAMLNMLDAEARVVQTADGLVPDELVGLSRDDARLAVLDAVMAAGQLKAVEDRPIQQPVGDRSGVVIEPWLTDQWYVDAKTLAGPAMEAVRCGEVDIVPASWEKTFFHWMENIQPWCVSRQLWWGHRIPVWYGKVLDRDGSKLIPRVLAPEGAAWLTFVALDTASVSQVAKDHYEAISGCEVEVEIVEEPSTVALNGWIKTEDGEPIRVKLTQETDVLDTWFSSALWPFATLGWPDTVPVGRTPNDLLISGFDILFFWDARMMMMAQQLTGTAPFKRLYLHGLVRAADGQKMSKSKGNTVDPIGLIDRFGADALRFFMTAMESQGRDVKMDEARLQGYRNFATKMWNAARFLQANGVTGATQPLPPGAAKPVNRWILAEAAEAVQAMELALADLRFDAAADAVYHFAWDRFCDWYLELIKGEVDAETRAVAGWTFDCILKMLHPIMPFVTEELWALTGDRVAPLIVSDWPQVDARSMDAEAAGEIGWLIDVVAEVRSVKAAVSLSPTTRTDLLITMPVGGAPAWEHTIALVDRAWRHHLSLSRTARINIIEFTDTGQAFDCRTGERIDRTTYDPSEQRSPLQFTLEGRTYIIPAEGLIDLDTERARLTKAVAAAEGERDALAKRLGNASFVERAKPEAVAKARADHAERAEEAEELTAALARLG